MSSSSTSRGAAVTVAILAVAILAAGFGLGRCTVDPVPTDDQPEIIVVATCAELDRSGYDGQASCVDTDGHVVRPGRTCGPEAVRGSDGTAECLEADGNAVPAGGGS